MLIRVRSGAAAGQVGVAGTFVWCSTRLLPKSLCGTFQRRTRQTRFETLRVQPSNFMLIRHAMRGQMATRAMTHLGAVISRSACDQQQNNINNLAPVPYNKCLLAAPQKLSSPRSPHTSRVR